MKPSGSRATHLALVAAATCLVPAAVAQPEPASAQGKITFVEGTSGNDYYKYPTSCSVEAIQGRDGDARYGMKIFCGKTGDFSTYVFQYTSSYGDDVNRTMKVGVEWFQTVEWLPGDHPLLQTDLVITPKDSR